MKTFWQIMKSVLMGWGMAAFAFAVVSLFNEEKITMRFLRVLLVDETLVTVTTHLLFASRNWNVKIWPKRIAASILSAVIGYTVIVLAGIAPSSWQLCVVFGASVIVAFVVFFIVDAVERRSLERINEKLSHNG